MRLIRFGRSVVLVLLITACAPAVIPVDSQRSDASAAPAPDTRATKTGSAPLTEPIASSTPIVVTVNPTPILLWKTYQNDYERFAVEYPAAWKIDAHVDPDGADVMTFSPSPDTDSTGITVIVRNGLSADEEILDMPNTRCQQVTISGLPGRRCFDTLASSISTTFLAQGRQYTVATFGKHLDQNIYQRLLESFTVTP